MSAELKSSPLLVLDNLDLLLATGKYNEALMLFTRSLAMLGVVSSGDWTTRSSEVPDWAEEGGELCQRLAAIWRRLLSSPADFSRLDANTLVANLDVLHAVLMATWEGHLDSYSRALHARLQGRFQPLDVLRLVLAWTPNSELEWSPFDFAHVLPDVVAAQAVATLASRVVETKSIAQAREKAITLLASGRIDIKRLSKFNAPGLVARAWLGIESRTDDSARSARVFLGQAGRQAAGLQELSLYDPAATVADRKPVMLVLVETGMDAFQSDGLCQYLDAVTDHDVVVVALGCELTDALDARADHVHHVRYSGARLTPAWHRLASLLAEWQPDKVLWSTVDAPVWRMALDGLSLAREMAVAPVSEGQERLRCACPPEPGARLRLLLPTHGGRLGEPVVAALRALDESPELVTRVTLVVGLGGTAISVMAARHNLLRSLLRPEFHTVNSAKELAVVARHCHAVVASDAGQAGISAGLPMLGADETLAASVALLLERGQSAA